MSQLEIRNVSKSFKTGPAVDAVSLAVEPGEIVAVFGPSGCGKTTLLRLIAGIEEPDGGAIVIDGRDITYQAPETRGIGMAFQNFALFPHMSAFDDVASGLTARGTAKANIAASVHTVAQMLKIEHVLGHRPRELSNGQKQRAALARALVGRPRLLLLDDPLRNVDAKLRYEMRLELPHVLRGAGSAVLYVTQDYREAMALADRIAVMIHGRIRQCDAPETIYSFPATVEIARLFGDPAINLLPVTVAGDGGTGACVTVANVALDIGPGFAAAAGKHCMLGLRPEDLTLQEHPEPETFPVDVLASTPVNERSILLARAADGSEILVAATRPPLGGRSQGRAYASFAKDNVLLFERQSGERLPRTDSAVMPRE